MIEHQAANENRIRISLFIGLMLIFLAVWKGDGGYRDLREYLDNAENLWLKGELSKPGEPGKYYIHPLGIAVLSGPFVIAGAAVEKITGGAVGHRTIAALSIPVFSALACLLLFEIGRELNLSPLVSLWGALMLGLATPLLSFTRLYFAEGGIALSICLASWAFLRAQRAEGRAVIGWALLAGAGLAGATACHFNNLFVSAILWIGMAASFLSAKDRLPRIAALTLIPVFAGSALLYMNDRRFGGPFATGYDAQLLADSAHPMSVMNVSRNIQYLGVWLMRVPWVVPALICLSALRPRRTAWVAALAVAALAHVAFFQTFSGLRTFPIRYHQSAMILLTVGLLLFGEWLWKHWGSRGLVYAGMLLLLWNAGHFIRSTDTPSTQAFWVSPESQGINGYVWYMQPVQSELQFGTPMGVLQWIVLALFLIAGCFVLVMAVRAAYRLRETPDSQARSPATIL